MTDFEQGERVRHTKWGSVGTVHLWESDPKEPDAAAGEVRWDGSSVADELELVAAHLVRHTDEDPDAGRQ
ncbi:hypothetical protein L3Q67_45030 (plasmid) [Saccharothrix sp. AJ9571]|nr:hypothetical protein L3Q67_45030 [Saccharothrix sp. AJ9571]